MRYFLVKIPMTEIIEVSQAANINDRIQSLPEVIKKEIIFFWDFKDLKDFINF